MRLFSVRLIFCFFLCVTTVSLLSSYYEVHSEKTGLRKDLERRAEVLAESLAGNVGTSFDREPNKRLLGIVQRFSHRERLAGVAIFDKSGAPIAASTGLPDALAPSVVLQAIHEDQGRGIFIRDRDKGSYLHIYVLPLRGQEGVAAGALAIVHDARYIDAQSALMWRQGFLRALILVFLASASTLLIVRWSIAGPIARAAQWIRGIRVGRSPSSRADFSGLDVLKPLASEVKSLAESLTEARSAADREAQLRHEAEGLWTAERLSVHIRRKLGESHLFVVSNREPYSHVHQGKSVVTIVPASGLVTALEPVLRACDGTWVAHGSGDADCEMADANDRLRVPPDHPRYTLRRVWLTEEEEDGYYNGFANEGIWPLCHIAHTRPIFRAADWDYYQKANQKFANAIVTEMADTEQPIVLVQDYHLALVPELIKKKRPDSRIAIFWHIPWPNPEAFAICPWQGALLEGLLGADLIGFHIQSHCTNFLQSVDRALECRIDWEHFSANRSGHQTLVKPFPISVDLPDPLQTSAQEVYEDRAALLRELGSSGLFLGVGVDRVDYTKGIPERFLAIERLLEKHPSYQGKFTFVQIGAPSRTHIKRYNDLMHEVEAEANRINARFETADWKPIVFLNRHHDHPEIQRYYRNADICMVTSLHDGMNLVAKEFVAARSDEQGVLLLSRFTGAARELRDAVLVNPYDIELTSEAIRFSLEMSLDEQRARMRALRQVIREHNIYRWAADMVADLCDVRLQPTRNGDAAMVEPVAYTGG